MPVVCLQAVFVNGVHGVFPKVWVNSRCDGSLYKLHEANFET